LLQHRLPHHLVAWREGDRPGVQRRPSALDEAIHAAIHQGRGRRPARHGIVGALLTWATRYRVASILSILVLLGIVSYRVVNGITEYRLVVPLDSADGLYPGSDVLIAGATSGTVRAM